MFLKFKVKFKAVLRYLSIIALLLHPVFASLNAVNSDGKNNLSATAQKESQAPGHEQLSAATRILKLDYTQTSLQSIQHARTLLEQAVQLGNKDAIRILADLLFVHNLCSTFVVVWEED